MDVAHLFKQNMKIMKGATLAVAIPLLAINCAVNYKNNFDSQYLEFPKMEKSTIAQRINPFDNLVNTPYALLGGAWDTALYAKLATNNTDTVGRILRGTVSTEIDTIINAASFPLLEVYQAVKGETWRKPYMPATTTSNQ
ncbi:MAG: hypothetical protein WCI72_04735 [archaeon]